ncbi:MAG: hypothetical protein QW199_01390 [Candidatus Pacearchaeota archaeon]
MVEMNVTSDIMLEINKKLNHFLSDERRIEFLESLLKKQLDKETKKAICLKISELYERKNLVNSSLQYLIQAEILTDKWAEKLPLLMRIAKIFVKLFDFMKAEEYFKQAIEIAPLGEVDALRQEYINYYIQEAQAYEEKGRPRKAIKFYEFLANKGIRRHEMFLKIADLYDIAAMPLEAGRLRRQAQLELEAEREKSLKTIEKQREEEKRADRLLSD